MYSRSPRATVGWPDGTAANGGKTSKTSVSATHFLSGTARAAVGLMRQLLITVASAIPLTVSVIYRELQARFPRATVGWLVRWYCCERCEDIEDPGVNDPLSERFGASRRWVNATVVDNGG